MVFSAVRKHTSRVAERIAAVFEVLGFTPNAITYLALVIVAAGSLLIAFDHLVWGAGIAGFGAILDAFDGALARRTGQVTAWGGYLDSVIDRYADALPFLAVAWHYQEAWIWVAVLVALHGAVTTSYARARTYQDVAPPSDAWSDLIERPERLLILLFLTGFQGISNHFGGDAQFLPWVVVLLAVAGHFTVLQRVARAKGFITGGRDG